MKIALERRTNTHATLRLSGVLRPGWCGKLATGLARAGIGIERGTALTISPGLWRAEFQLACGPEREPSATEIGTLLAARDGSGFTTPIVLRRYALAPSDTHGGCLRLEVEGDDRLGFLAALLRRLAFFSLFPAELCLETLGERVQDQLWLRAGGGRAPLEATAKALGASLEPLVKPD